MCQPVAEWKGDLENNASGPADDTLHRGRRARRGSNTHTEESSQCRRKSIVYGMDGRGGQVRREVGGERNEVPWGSEECVVEVLIEVWSLWGRIILHNKAATFAGEVNDYDYLLSLSNNCAEQKEPVILAHHCLRIHDITSFQNLLVDLNRLRLMVVWLLVKLVMYVSDTSIPFSSLFSVAWLGTPAPS